MKFRRKPIVVEAVQFTGKNGFEVVDWAKSPTVDVAFSGDIVVFSTMSAGLMRAAPGDWVVKGTNGEFYTIKDAIFREIYEIAADGE